MDEGLNRTDKEANRKIMTARKPQLKSWQPELLGLWSFDLPTEEKGSSPRSPAEEVHASAKALPENRPLRSNLMEQVVLESNLFHACKRVVANKGRAGVDGQTVQSLQGWLNDHVAELREDLLKGSYTPSPVLGVQIPKPGGGKRQLGIPTVKDRLVQQAIQQVLEPVLDPTFSESSYGFRRGRSAHDALRAGSAYVEEGYEIVVDLDLEKFFDRVNHDILMSRLARHIEDKALLGLTRRFLQAGMMTSGVCIPREEGTPQGGPLSPLLANLLLDDLDKELERRGHRFCRYADDCNIYVRSEKAGERVLKSVTDYLETKLKLQVNQSKSHAGPVWERKFLGYRILRGGRLTVAPQSIARAKERVRKITRRNRGRSLKSVIGELNTFIRGWVGYFRLAYAKGVTEKLDAWVRRKLRCLKLKHCKRAIGVGRFLRSQGLDQDSAWKLAGSGKGWWRKSLTPQSHRAMGTKWFVEIGFEGFANRYEQAKCI